MVSLIVDAQNYTVREGKRGKSCQVKVWDPIQGKQVTKTFKIPPGLSKTKEAAFCTNCAEDFKKTVLNRTSPTSPKISFDEFFKGEWREEKLAGKTSEWTVYDYMRWYDYHLRDRIGSVPLCKITPRMISDVYLDLSESGVSDNMSNRLAKLLLWSLDSATRRGIIPANPAACVPAPKKGPGKSEAEREAICGE